MTSERCAVSPLVEVPVRGNIFEKLKIKDFSLLFIILVKTLFSLQTVLLLDAVISV